jgi:hypothetical protein
MAEEVPKTAGITLAQLGASGRLVIVQCSECSNRRHLDLPMDTSVSAAGALLRCCGADRRACSPTQRVIGTRARGGNASGEKPSGMGIVKVQPTRLMHLQQRKRWAGKRYV